MSLIQIVILHFFIDYNRLKWSSEKQSSIIYSIKCHVAFQNPLVELFYVVFIGEHGEMKLERKTRKRYKTDTFSTKMEDWMVPSVNMIVFTHSQFGEFIFDATKVNIDAKASNKMSIKILPEERKSFEFLPGSSIEMKLIVDEKNDEKSSLHLLSVDERVRYFGNHNDITNAKFQAEVHQHFEKRNFSEVRGKYDDRYNHLANFNAFFITNAYIEEKDCTLLGRSSGSNISQSDETVEAGTRRSGELSIVRRDFPETFLFEDISGAKLNEDKASKTYTLKTTTPHSITRFFVNGFVFHPVHGLGIANEKNFTVIKDFFVKAFLPHSIHVDEVMKVNIAAFNFLRFSNQAITAKITIEKLYEGERSNRASYNFVSISKKGNTCAFTSIDAEEQKTTVSVGHNKGATVDFYIRAHSEGKLHFKVTATAEDYTDIMVQTITVEPHGRRKSVNKGFFIDLRQQTTTSFGFECKFPDNIVQGTQKVFATAYGNILGQALTGVSMTTDVPHGKLEQNLQFLSILVIFIK